MGKWMPIDDFVFTASAERLPMYPTEIRVTNQGRTVILAEYETEYEIDFQDKRLCRLTDDAPGDMPRYSHRNGETEPPTTKGNYWVKGFATINGAIMRLSLMLTVADWRDSAMYAKLPDGGLVTVRGTSTGFASAEWNCEWWGPVMPPWEANNE